MSPLTELAHKSNGHLVLFPDFEPLPPAPATVIEAFAPAEYVARLQAEIGRLTGVILQREEDIHGRDGYILDLTAQLNSSHAEIDFLKRRYEQ